MADKTRFSVWGISQDEPAETLEFIRQHGLQFPVLIDTHPFRVSKSYEVAFVPTLYLVEGGGRLQLSDYGFSKATLNRVAQTIGHYTNRPVIQLFRPDDGLPETRPG